MPTQCSDWFNVRRSSHGFHLALLNLLLDHLRPHCVAVGRHDFQAIVAGLVDLEILRPLAPDQQPLAMHFLATLTNTLLHLLLLLSGWVSALLCC